MALGEILATAFDSHIKEAPGEVIEEILNDRLKENHRLITEFGRLAQDILNKRANIGLSTRIPKVSQDRIDGLVGRLKEDDFEKNRWLLNSPIVNFSQSVVDDMIRKNAEFHFHSGMSPKIVRKEVGNCCKWCKSLVGTYSYPDVPKDVYRRHRNCHCTVDYYPGNGKKQNVHTKGWSGNSKRDKIIDERKQLISSNEISSVRKGALKNDIVAIPIQKSKIKKIEGEIISAVGGGDKTEGSCSSLALAYIGNKAGFDVLDYRGGASRSYFSSPITIRKITELPGVKSHIVLANNDFIANKKLIAQMKEDKEYYLATGRHAAIIRKKDGELQYLELQAPFGRNGFKTLDDNVFKKRFACQKSRTIYGQKFETEHFLIDADSLGANEEFQKILGFINTKKNKQIKGDEGYVK